MTNKILEGTEQRYISRKASKYATNIVESFLNDQKCNYGFLTQYDFRTDLESYVSDNSNDFDNVPDLPNISRALSLAKDKRRKVCILWEERYGETSCRRFARKSMIIKVMFFPLT